MGASVRYPLLCESSFEESARRVVSHRHVDRALGALAELGRGSGGALPTVPPEVPALSDLYAEGGSWTELAVADRTATAVAQLFAGGGDEAAWQRVVDHLQHLVHCGKPHVTAGNASAGAVLLAAACVLPDHPWASVWAMAGSLRLAAWLDAHPGQTDEAVQRRADLAMEVLSALADVAPALPEGAFRVLASGADRSVEPAGGVYAMHPSDEQLACLLTCPPEAAVEAFAERIRLLRRDRRVGDLFDEQGAPDRGELEEICRNVLTLRAHMHVKHDYGRQVDWATILNGDIESNVSLNHHFHIAALVSGYRAYGDVRYAEHAVRMLRSWFDQSPCPSVWGQLQWRTLEVGGRLTSAWPAIAMGLIDYEPFVTSCLTDLVRWAVASARFLCVFPGPWNNWLQVECSGGLAATALVPEWRDAELARAVFTQRLAWINRHMFLPDGMQSENAPHYHAFPWSRLYVAAVLDDALGKPVASDYWEFLVRGAEPFWKLRMPDGSLPSLSDASPRHNSGDGWLRIVGHQRQRPQMLAVLEPEAAGDSLPEPCQRLPHAGLTVLRTGWGRRDDYVLFDHGFFGTNHQHEDKLTFLYASGGRLLVGDAGIYRYSNDEWEHYFRGAWGHNVVVVDGKQQCRVIDHLRGIAEPIPDPDARQEVELGRYGLLSGWYRDGFAPRSFGLWERHADRSSDEAARDRSIQHQRLLLYVWRRGLLVIDRVMGSGRHEVVQVFHLHPFEEGVGEERTYEPGALRLDNRIALLSHPDQTGVVLVPSRDDVTPTSYCGREGPVRGWTALYGEQPSHDVHYTGQVELPAVLGVWIEPTTPGAAADDLRLDMAAEGDRIRFGVKSTGGLLSGVLDAGRVTVEQIEGGDV